MKFKKSEALLDNLSFITTRLKVIKELAVSMNRWLFTQYQSLNAPMHGEGEDE
jgi:hypothetical protein